ncbi:MAG: response regulator [Desulfobacterales bacterium]|nr:response regulator [Desulfobacterales bacterium]
MNQQKKILVVDDSPILRDIIKYELEEGGYKVYEATDGIMAMAKVAEVIPDLITLDVEMPKLNGFETFKRIYDPSFSRYITKENGEKMPVIFITSNDSLKERRLGFELGAADFISKPFTKGEVINAVNKILRAEEGLKNLRALVVDDSPVARKVISSTLKSEGIAVIEAVNGLDAYIILCEMIGEIDIVITDLMMPKMKGDELCKKIRDELKLIDMPVIVLTASDDHSSILNVFKSGASDYVIKPFAKEELLARIMVRIERTKLNKRLKEAISELKELNKMKHDFLSICSKDLNAPLKEVVNYSGMLLEREYIQNNDKEKIKQIIEQANLVSGFINDFLDINKAKRKKTKSNLERISIFSVVTTSIHAMKNLAAQKNHQIKKIDNSGSVYIIGNRNGIIRLINNLLSNAIKFTSKDGEITITINKVSENEISISVSDTGLGIPEDKIKNLFDKYTKISTPGTMGEKSTGLGMSIIKEIVDAHSGRIEVKSKVGEGTCFTVIFPLEEAKKEKAKSENVIKEKQENPSDIDIKKKVLIVEDFESNIMIIKEFLKKSPYELEFAQNGEEAVQKYKENNYDVIMMDMYMPIMDGTDASRKIREFEKQRSDKEIKKRTPIVAMTGSSSHAELKQCVESEMDDFLFKPFNKESILNMIDKWANSSPTTPRSSSIDNLLNKSIEQSFVSPINKTNENNNPIDMKKALAEFDNDKELLMEVIKGFVGKVRDSIITIRKAVNTGDIKSLQYEAHTIKGGSSNLTACSLSNAAMELEELAKQNKSEKFNATIENLESEFYRLDSYLMGLDI